jgi:putative beta-lysine N-acetyltransferase
MMFRSIKLDSLAAEVEISLYNKRLTILSYKFLNSRGIMDLTNSIDQLCTEYSLDKVWGKIRSKDLDLYTSHGFIPEAHIDEFFINEDAVICAKFFKKRHLSTTVEKNQQVLEHTALTQLSKQCSELPEGYKFKIGEPQDTNALSSLFSRVFETYPYPVFDQSYLRSSLGRTIYGLVYNAQGVLAAVASAETNPIYKNAEMTDFATLPEERGKGLASFILDKLEHILKNQSFNSVYTIARSTSLSMNKVFKQAGYRYTGTLTKNCHIAGSFQDMNVWCKML